MKSMTGYGEKRIQKEKVEIFLQIKTLNHRFLQIKLTCSEAIPYKWEKKIESLIKDKIKRGRVEVSLKINRKRAPFFQIKPNLELASEYYETLTYLSKNLKLKEPVNLSHLLNFPGVVEAQETEKKEIEKLIEQAIRESLKKLLEGRGKEGREHRKSILGCIEKIENRILEIEKEAPLSQNLYREKIKEELLQTLKEKINLTTANQVALLVTRGDIKEELVRFLSHLDQLKKTLQEKEPIGKKINFILQELNREINTMGAKSSSFLISQWVVEIKDSLEMIREQAYNLE